MGPTSFIIGFFDAPTVPDGQRRRTRICVFFVMVGKASGGNDFSKRA
jgi:hypothetical protein